ncbi:MULTISPECIES: class I SAM-dependent methyltransferase [unclassified Rhizobium]|uniref:class I SAM-dependent methyltransferase n=1 Tax=unclassified Rhizobium TaxID=2613769 RepID=UPI00177F8C84|nr:MULTISPECIES: class I SAM-dependent methyltransferase [unclassified Rhizobium]MBD8688105.1 class I SAM-dependent methyltransferase [Rhizobium sp. CFBP 13644]MBD8692560.1 class I SAM-dependent methyltransferase [Rhizobium sp. CFBP 13717]
MSRLDSFIRRLSAQRDILNHVHADMGLPAGPIMEIGLGNGRTFNHLRELFPDRRIVAFDRAMGAHASSVPDEKDMVIGEIAQTAQAYLGIEAALVHADIGTGYPEKDAVTLTWLPQLVAGMLAEGGVAISGLPLEEKTLNPLPVPASVPTDRYFLYRKI